MASVLLKDARLTFPALFTAKQVQGQGEAKFSAGFLLPRNHPQLKEVEAALLAVATEKWGAKSGEVLKALKAGDRMCVHDGDSKSDYDGYAGQLFINASNKIRPLVIDANRNPIEESAGTIYSGCYVNVKLEFWAQDNQFGKRINASLLGVQFAKDGERLAGGSVATVDDFEAVPAAAQTAAAASGAGAAGLFG